jgi:hypothetical protein
MFKPKSCLTSYGGELGSYIGIQGDMGRKGTSWWVKPDESGHRAGWTGSGTGPSGSKPDSGPDVTGRGFGSPGIASGWHRSTFRSKTGRLVRSPVDRACDRAVRSGARSDRMM